MRLQYFFHSHPPRTVPQPFRRKSFWAPPDDVCPQLQQYFDKISVDINKIIRSAANPTPHNLTPIETESIKTLCTRKDITIKPADKGGAIVLWSIEAYLKEANNQLSNPLHYRKLESDGIQLLSTQITTFLTHLLGRNLLTQQCYDFLEPSPHPCTPEFYLLPKIHKPKINDLTPGRPIISGCGSPTEKLSKFLDHFLKPIVKTIPSYIKDTNHFLQIIIRERHNFPPGIILCTLDVKSLYTNIPQDEGILHCMMALIDFYATGLPLPATHLQQMFEFILKGNYFSFNGQPYLQTHGTAMGTPFAPNFANIFMSVIEQNILSTAPEGKKPLIWKRFIDDIFMIWQYDEASLTEFLAHTNNVHNTIKFEAQQSRAKINFLDTTIYLNNNSGLLESTLFVKPTDICTLLHAKSFHPPSCKKSVIYSQALRFRRLITDNNELHKHLKALQKNLIIRGYESQDITTEFSKLTHVTQYELLFPGNPANNETTLQHLNFEPPPPKPQVLPFVVPFDIKTINIGSVLTKHWHLISADAYLKEIWNDTRPVLALTRRPNLKDRLVHSKLGHQHKTASRSIMRP